MGERVIYQSTEKLVIIKELKLDYLVEDVDTGRQYVVDKTYFTKRYEAMGMLITTEH